MKKTMLALLCTAATFPLHAATLPTDLEWVTNMDEPLFASSEAKRGGTLRTHLPSFPQTLRSVGPDANAFFRHYFMDGTPKLAKRHPDTGKWIPELASAWAFGDDNRTVYFKLDKTARWSDGEPITADDYLFMLTYNRSQDIVDPWYNDFFTRHIINVTKFDDHTIAIEVGTPQSQDALMVKINLPSNGVQPRPEHFFAKEKDANNDGMPDNFVRKFNFKVEPTASPYVIDKIKKGKSITFKHVGEDWWGYNNRYFQNRYNVDKIRLTVIRDEDIALKHFEKGSLDLYEMNLPEVWHQKSESKGYRQGYIQKFWGYNQVVQGAGGVWMNTAKPLLNDLNVRKGIVYATDFDGMIKNVMRGDYSRKPHALGFGHGQYDKPNATPPPFDPERAVKYFEAAGFDTVGADGIRVNEQGERLSFALTYGYNVFTPRIAFLKEQAKQAGLDLTLDLVDGSSMFKYVLEKKHELAFLNMGGGEIPAYWEYFHSSNTNRPQTNAHTNFSSEKLDALIGEYDQEFDEQKRYALSHQIQDYVEQAHVIVPGYMAPYSRGVHWRWFVFPDNPMTKNTRFFFHPMTQSNFWIDTDLKKQTKQAMKDGETFPVINVLDDRYKL